MHGWDERVAVVADVLVVLAPFVAGVVLALQEGDHQRVLQPETSRVPVPDVRALVG